MLSPWGSKFLCSRRSSDSLPEWGVTVLQADEEMDAGDVWKSCNFSVPHSSTLTKSAFYNKVLLVMETKAKRLVSVTECLFRDPVRWLFFSPAFVGIVVDEKFIFMLILTLSCLRAWGCDGLVRVV